MADRWVRWLIDGHLAAVLAGGATDAEVVEMDPTTPGRSLEVRYHFPSRQHFEQYEREHAPALRADGLELFPVEKGISYRRCVGRVVARLAGKA
jgi:hypothetical protein